MKIGPSGLKMLPDLLYLLIVKALFFDKMLFGKPVGSRILQPEELSEAGSWT